MSKMIDATGKACPMPVMMTKNEIDRGEEAIITKVDNNIAVENLKRLAHTTGYTVEVKEENGIYAVALSKECESCKELFDQMEKENGVPSSDYVVFIGSEYIGEGSEELGKNLIRMFFYTLTQGKDLPRSLLFMNGGVKLPTYDQQVIDHLKLLQEQGVEILVCGTCLNYYQITDELKIGIASNMYEITDRMKQAAKVISF